MERFLAVTFVAIAFNPFHFQQKLVGSGTIPLAAVPLKALGNFEMGRFLAVIIAAIAFNPSHFQQKPDGNGTICVTGT